MSLENQIPGLKEAISRERISRGSSFLAINETVCGEEIKPMNLLHIITLEAIESPFVMGGTVYPSDVLSFMVVLSGASGWRRKRLLRRLGKIKYPDAVASVSGFVQEAMQDSPACGPSMEAGEQYYSVGASIVDALCREYGWSEESVLRIPLKRIFQYIKILSRRAGESVMFNPSDKVRGEWLARDSKN